MSIILELLNILAANISRFTVYCLLALCLQDSRTALHLAASYGNYEIVKILVSACANVDTTSIKVSVLPVIRRRGSPHGKTN